MLLDAKHKRWCVVTVALAVVLTGAYLCCYWTATDGLTGGGVVGLCYGVLGSGLMVFAGLLSGLRRLPAAFWLGSRQAWLRGHIWLGLLSVVVILCHSGGRWGGWLERALWVVLGVVILSGVVGLLLQQYLPRMLTTRIPAEAPYEQIPHICRVLRQKADALIERLCPTGATDPKAASVLGEPARTHLRTFFDNEVWPFLAVVNYRAASPLAHPLQAETAFARVRELVGKEQATDELTTLERYCTERRLLAEQERLHYWLHGWLLLHVPLSVALLVLGVAHAIMSLYY